MSTKARTKTEDAYNSLRRDILEVRLAPSTPLKLHKIQEMYGLGWTPLREALSQLEAEHLVISIPNKGYVVTPVSLSELEDLTKTKKILELPLLREAIEFGDTSWEAGIVAAHYRLSKEASPLDGHIDAENYIAWTRVHNDFHSALLSASKSAWQQRFHVQVTDHMRRHGRALRASLSYTQSENYAAALKASPALREAYCLEPHTALMDAVLNREVEKACELTARQIDLIILSYSELSAAGMTEIIPE